MCLFRKENNILKRIYYLYVVSAALLPLLFFGCDSLQNYMDVNSDETSITGNAYPTVLWTNPGRNNSNVSSNSNISATFSARMDSDTINTSTFTVSDGTTNITGTVFYDSNSKTAVFTPSLAITRNRMIVTSPKACGSISNLASVSPKATVCQVLPPSALANTV